MGRRRKLASVAFVLVIAGVVALAWPAAYAVPATCPLATIHVFKREGEIELRCAGVTVVTAGAVFGAEPRGHKVRAGDERTPEGTYAIIAKRRSPRFDRFLLLSYPGPDDRRRARTIGVDPGGAIGIHGSRVLPGALARAGIRVWSSLGLAGVVGPTDGCIGVANELVTLLDRVAPLGTPVVIQAAR